MDTTILCSTKPRDSDNKIGLKFHKEYAIATNLTDQEKGVIRELTHSLKIYEKLPPKFLEEFEGLWKKGMKKIRKIELRFWAKKFLRNPINVITFASTFRILKFFKFERDEE